MCNEEREKAASKCVRLCLCACVLLLSSFLCLSTEWKKADGIKKDKRERKSRSSKGEGLNQVTFYFSVRKEQDKGFSWFFSGASPPSICKIANIYIYKYQGR